MPTEEWIEKSGAFQPIVDQQVCDRVQRVDFCRLARNRVQRFP